MIKLAHDLSDAGRNHKARRGRRKVAHDAQPIQADRRASYPKARRREQGES